MGASKASHEAELNMINSWYLLNGAWQPARHRMREACVNVESVSAAAMEVTRRGGEIRTRRAAASSVVKKLRQNIILCSEAM